MSVCAGITADDMLTIFREKVGKNQRDAAVRFRVSTSFLSDVLNGRRGISDELAQRLGYERKIVFVKRKVE